ncbi:MAG: hypothetical protein HQ495_02710 [Alphaproteobacteria bacterium]|nr:hypothetical protein [Alphaproteobacteria bacterium]
MRQALRRRKLRLRSACVLLALCASMLPTAQSIGQQAGGLSTLAEELLKRLDNPDGAPGEPEAIEPVDPGSAISDSVVAVDPVASPAIRIRLPAPLTGPEADLARRLLAITDTEEAQDDERQRLARDFVSRLRGPLLDTPLAEDAPEFSEAALRLQDDTAGIQDGEELILEVQIDGRRFVQSIFTIKQGDGILVDLAEITQLLDFSIEVDPVRGTAGGFFIDPTHTFNLDLEAGIVEIEGERVPVRSEDIRRTDDTIFVHSDTFAAWFGVRLDVDFRQLVVDVIPETPLPLQQRFERQQRIADARRNRSREPEQPFLDEPYRLFAEPFVDVALASSYFDAPGQTARTTQTYSVVGRGDLGFATGDFFLAGNQDDLFNSARLSLRREDPTGGLLGPLQATRAEIGDITGVGLPIASGIGASVTNNTTGVQNLGTSTDFVGTEQPGTDIELYRNEVLLNLVTVGDDGRYEFRNVPLVLGANAFRLVFYGPQGDRREQREVRNVTSVGERTNLPIYTAAVAKPGNPLIPLAATGQADQPLGAGVTVQQTLTSGRTVNAGLSFTNVEEPRTGTAQAGISSPLFSGSASLSATTSLDTGWSANGSYRTLYRDQSLSLGYSATRASGTGNQDQFTVSASGSIPIVGKLSLPYNADATRTLSGTGTTVDQANLRNSVGSGRLRASNSFAWSQTDSSAGNTKQLNGLLSVTGLLFPVVARLGANYRLIEQRELTQLDAEVSWTVNNRVQTRIGAQRFLISQRDALSLGLNWQFDRFIFSPSLSYDSNDQLFAFVNVRFSAARDPISGKAVLAGNSFSNDGAVAARVYRDDNLNQVFDPGESVIEDARIEAVQSNRSQPTDEDGVAFVRRLPPYLLTDVRIRPGSLPDPFLAPVGPGRSILPRPGFTHILDFPVALTTEIDGTVVALRPDQPLLPLPGVTVELRNASGEIVDKQGTLFDGFFLFVNVLPGEYTLQLADENVTTQGFVIPSPRRIFVAKDAEPILGVQIVTGPPDMELPAPADAKIAGVSVGRFPTLESARATLKIYRELFPERLGRLDLVTPLEEQVPPFDLQLGPVSRGAADNICGRLTERKVPCEISLFPYVAEAPIGPPAPVAAPPAEDNPAAGSADQAPALAETDAAAGEVLIDLGRYPSADRADVAWSLLRRLYAKELDGADRQTDRDTAAASLVVGPLPEPRAHELCAAIASSVPICAVRPLVPNVPLVQEGPSRLPVLPTLRATVPALPSLRPAAPVVVADPVPEVEARPLPQVAALPAMAVPSENGTETVAVGRDETVIAVRLGEFGSQTGVDAGWQLMRRLYPVALAGARLLEGSEPSDAGRPLLAGPFTEIHALSVCARLIADGQTCRVTRARL